VTGTQIGILIGLATFVCSLIGYAIKLTWQLAQQLAMVEKDIREDMDAQIDNLQRDVVKLTGSAGERADTIRHEFGETVAAIRQKVHDVETWNRDNFVRKESFELVIRRIENSLEKLGDRFEEKMDALVRHILDKQ
jgi:hypothetical protein